MSTSRPILIAGCGPSILNVPDKLWFSMPVFAVNRFVTEHYITPEYWTAWDTWSLVECLPVAAQKGAKIHLNERVRPYFKNTPELHSYPVTWWQDATPIGVPRNINTGMVFIGSTHAALWRAHMLGFDEFYIVGFDCTIGIDPVHDNNHFYGQGKNEIYARAWDEQMSYIARALEAAGKIVWNISEPSAARITPRASMESVLERFV